MDLNILLSELAGRGGIWMAVGIGLTVLLTYLRYRSPAPPTPTPSPLAPTPKAPLLSVILDALAKLRGLPAGSLTADDLPHDVLMRLVGEVQQVTEQRRGHYAAALADLQPK